ncbi:MAG: AAA family ATPase [Bacteroidia bacterium]
MQYLAEARQKGIYLSLDDFYFQTNRLVETVDALYQKGYRLFLFDEVHRYQHWSKDLKQLYDDYDDIQMWATGSSILDIARGSTDLSRRATVYRLHGLSFREFLNFRYQQNFSPLSLPDLLQHHQQLAPELCDQLQLTADFQDYLRFGYFPYFMEAKASYFQKLQDSLHLVIDADIAPYEELQHATTRNLKKLLFVLSQTVPFTPNINKLAERIESPLNTILKLLDIMHQGQLLKLLRSENKGVSYLQKPEKIYLQNTNFIYLFSPEQANVGNVRETFFFNQLSHVHQVTAPRYGDFLIDDSFVFEIGGPGKTDQQLKGLPQAYLAIDAETGGGRHIPLWLFGFLY